MRNLLYGFILIALVITNTTFANASEVTVYSARQEHLIKPLFDKFTSETGIEVRYITGKAGALFQRIAAEGKNTKADVLMTVDAGNLWNAAEKGIFQEVSSQKLNDNVPANLRDADGRWYGLSVRARPIVYSTERVKPSELSTYAALTDEKWKDRICLRTSKKIYNQSLVAMLIKQNGKEKTGEIIKGWVDNLAVAPLSSDTKVIEAISAGSCDVGIVNTYYLGRILKKDPDFPVSVFWPNQDEDGVHVNISGAGVTKYAKNKDNAVKLLEWLTSEKAQTDIADNNLEYTVLKETPYSSVITKWGDFKGNDINVAWLGELQTEAIILMNKYDYK